MRDHDAGPPSGKPSEGHRRHGAVPLRSYAAIGDGRTVALIALDGQIDWLPIPSLDSPVVFGALLDAKHGGHISLRPTGPATAERAYLPGTNVLVTTWTTPTGTCTVTDAMATGTAGRLPWAEICRRVHGIDGEVDLTWEVAPGTLLGTAEPRLLDTVNGPVVKTDDVMIGITQLGFRPDPQEGPRYAGRFRTSAGSDSVLAVVGTLDEPLFLPSAEESLAGADRTIANWEAWSSTIAYEGPWHDAVVRSLLALKLLIYAPTGAIAAAATTSLPEATQGGKNWDYRFAWIRDLSYTVHALGRFGIREETHAAVSWMMRTVAEHNDGMPIFYRLDGSRADGVLQRDVRGWSGIGPVVEGNRASHQLQLGVWGDMLELMREYVAQGNVLDERTAGVLGRIADEACTRWQQPDSGMWELEEQQHYVTSKLGCWQALDAAIELHDKRQIRGSRETWEENRSRIAEWVGEHGWDEKLGRYVMFPGSASLDASILLHARTGFDQGPRMSATIDAIIDELAVGPLVYRYSGMKDEESPFVACSFWLAAALAALGRVGEARRIVDAMVDEANDVGMYSEMISADTHAFMGNLPQGLSHLALIQAAFEIRRAERHEGR